jgi:hypothetical protein
MIPLIGLLIGFCLFVCSIYSIASPEEDDNRRVSLRSARRDTLRAAMFRKRTRRE